MKLSLGLSIVGVAALTASIALAQNTRDPGKTAPKPPATQPSKQAAPAHAPELPPGMSAADMQACMEAGTPGPMHQHLLDAVGVWHGKSTMWMTPAAEPLKSECVSTITSAMDGRFTKCEMQGDMPGMGPFNGFGISGYDNVAKKFQASWIDNCGTGIMNGTGELSSDGKTLTWNYTYNCPITRKPAVMREVDRRTGKDTMTMEMYSTDPGTGKEFKMMEIAFTRKPGTTAAATR